MNRKSIIGDSFGRKEICKICMYCKKNLTNCPLMLFPSIYYVICTYIEKRTFVWVFIRDFSGILLQYVIFIIFWFTYSRTTKITSSPWPIGRNNNLYIFRWWDLKFRVKIATDKAGFQWPGLPRRDGCR